MFASRIGALIAIAIGGFLVWAAVSKLIDVGPATLLLRKVAVWDRNLAMHTVQAVSFVEWCIGLWLICGYKQSTGAIVTIALVASLTPVLVFAKIQGYGGECGCGGIPLSIDAALVRNGVILGLLTVPLVAGRQPALCTSGGMVA